MPQEIIKHQRLLITDHLMLPFLACPSAPPPTNAFTTIIALRHADWDGPKLNTLCHVRAADLPAAMWNYEIEAICAPNIDRNLNTAAPLFKATEQPVIRILTENVAGQITSAYPEGAVVWAGNKNNIKALWKDPNAPGEPPLKYRNLFIVKLNSFSIRRVTRLHYGE